MSLAERRRSSVATEDSRLPITPRSWLVGLIKCCMAATVVLTTVACDSDESPSTPGVPDVPDVPSAPGSPTMRTIQPPLPSCPPAWPLLQSVTKQDPNEVSGVALCANFLGKRALANNGTAVWGVRAKNVGEFSYVSQSYLSEGLRRVAANAGLPFRTLAPGDVLLLLDGYVSWTLDLNLSYAWEGLAQPFDSLTKVGKAGLIRFNLKSSPRSATAIYTCLDQTYKSIGSAKTVLNDADAAARVRAGLNTAAQAGRCATAVKEAARETGAVKVPTFLDVTEKVGQRAGQATAFETRLGKLNAYLRYVCEASRFC